MKDDAKKRIETLLHRVDGLHRAMMELPATYGWAGDHVLAGMFEEVTSKLASASSELYDAVVQARSSR